MYRLDSLNGVRLAAGMPLIRFESPLGSHNSLSGGVLGGSDARGPVGRWNFIPHFSAQQPVNGPAKSLALKIVDGLHQPRRIGFGVEIKGIFTNDRVELALNELGVGPTNLLLTESACTIICPNPENHIWTVEMCACVRWIVLLESVDARNSYHVKIDLLDYHNLNSTLCQLTIPTLHLVIVDVVRS